MMARASVPICSRHNKELVLLPQEVSDKITDCDVDRQFSGQKAYQCPYSYKIWFEKELTEYEGKTLGL